MAAVLILSRQVQDDLPMTSEDDTLLRDPENVFIRAPEVERTNFKDSDVFEDK